MIKFLVRFLILLGVWMGGMFGEDIKKGFQSVLPKYEMQVLDNGLQVVVIPIKNNSGVIQTNIFYKVGSRNEVMGKSGIAHMLEHMNFKTTKNLRAGEFDEIVKKFGGVDNASTSFDYTHYFIKSSSSNLSKSLELFAELMSNLTIDDSDFQVERNVVAEERRWRTDNSPFGYLYFRFFNTAYVYHPYHWTPIGFMDDILNWSVEDIRDFHKIYYQPKNAVLLVSGDIESEDVFRLAKKYFSSISNTEEIPSIYTKEPLQDGSQQVLVYKDSSVEYLALGFKIPPFNHKDQIALSALSYLLSGGNSSVLYQKLVDSEQLASRIYAYNMDLIDEGVFVFMAVANAGVDALDIKRKIQEIIIDLQNGGITKAQLDKLKINIKAEFYNNLEDSSSVSNLFGSYFARGDITPLLDYERNFEALNEEDLIRVAKKYLVIKNSTTVIVKPDKEDLGDEFSSSFSKNLDIKKNTQGSNSQLSVYQKGGQLQGGWR